MALPSPFSPGGTPGGLVPFVAGLGMAIGGGYMLASKIQVSSGYWNMWGHSAFGLTLVPLMIGIGMLFFDGRSIIGRVLLFGGLIMIVAGILLNLQIYFHSTSLYDTIIMLALLAGGVGLVLRSLKSTA